MPTDENNKTPTNATLAMIGQAGKAALQKTASKAALAALVAGIRKLLLKAGAPAELVENEIATKVFELAAPMLFNLLASNYGAQIDQALGAGKAEIIAQGSKMALEAALTDDLFQLLEMAEGTIFPLMKDMLGDMSKSTEGIRGLAGEESTSGKSRVREA